MSRSDGWRLSIPKARISSCCPFGRHSLRRADEGDRRTGAIVRYVLTAPVRPHIPSLDQRGGEGGRPVPSHEPPAPRASAAAAARLLLRACAQLERRRASPPSRANDRVDVADPTLRTAGASIVPAGSEIPLLVYASHL